MKIPEKGIVYKTSRLSYMSNYVILVLFTLFFILLFPNLMELFGITEFKPAIVMKTQDELFSTILVFAYLISAVILIEEPTVEQTIRQYIVTNDEIIKRDGIIRKKEFIIPYNVMAGVIVKRGLVGRILNYGTVYISALGKMEDIVMKGMRDPDTISRIIKNKIALKRGHIIKKEK